MGSFKHKDFNPLSQGRPLSKNCICCIFEHVSFGIAYAEREKHEWKIQGT